MVIDSAASVVPVKGFQLYDDLLCVGRIDLQKSAGSAPSTGDNDHLHVDGFAGLGLNDGGRFVLSARLDFVLAGLSMNRKPGTIRQTIQFFVVEVDRRLEGRTPKVTFSEKRDGRTLGVVRYGRCVRRGSGGRCLRGYSHLLRNSRQWER